VLLLVCLYNVQLSNVYGVGNHDQSQYSFYRPTEGRRLSRPRHCSKDAQPVPKAVYRSGCRDKHIELSVVRFEPGSSRVIVVMCMWSDGAAVGRWTCD